VLLGHGERLDPAALEGKPGCHPVVPAIGVVADVLIAEGAQTFADEHGASH
jgi:hypothetical protein